VSHRFVIAGALLLSLAGQPGCNPAQTSQSRKPRMIVLGIDGMDPGFLEAHWSALPNLDRLRRQGEFKRLATTIPPQSPVAWSTFITGMDPGGHGIYDFIHRNPETALPYSSMSEVSDPERTLSIGPYVLPLSKGRVRSLRKGKAFWQVLSDHQVPVNIIRMPTNFPPLECEGASLSGMGTPDMRGTFGTFSFYTSQPGAAARQAPGGQIVPVAVTNHHAELRIEGPANSMRKDRARSFTTLAVDIDPAEPVARFRAGGSTLLLKEGEWSGWIGAEFPLIRGLKSAYGMFRIYAKKLKPELMIYVSPINIDPARPELPVSEPASYSRDLARALGPFYTQGMAEDTAALRQGIFTREEYLAQSRLVAAEHLRILRYGIQNFREGFLFFHFFGIDQNSHMLWGKYDRELLETYRLVDQAVGWVLEHAGDSAVVVMSDHGFAAFDRTVHLNSWLLKEGFLSLEEPGKTGNEELFAHVDWSRTQAYSLGLNGLYLNLAGRERNGIVAGAERAGVLGKIQERLTAFTDPKTGARVVDTAYRPADTFRGTELANAPDLIVGYRPGYRSSWQTALGAVPSAIVEDNTEAWIGDHCIAAHFVPGSWLSNRPGRLADPRLQDLPVTILRHYGIPPEPGMIGRPAF